MAGGIQSLLELSLLYHEYTLNEKLRGLFPFKHDLNLIQSTVVILYSDIMLDRHPNVPAPKYI